MNSTSSGASVKIKNKNKFGIVPDFLLENRILSLQARCVAAWLVGRSDNFEIRIESLRRMLGISENGWRTIRKELEFAGFWKSFRKSDEKGIFFWEHVFEYSGETTIPPEPMDGETDDWKKTKNNNFEHESKDNTIPPVAMHGSAMHGYRQDIPIGEYHEDFNQQEKEKTKATTTTTTTSVVVVDDEDENVQELVKYGFSKKQANELISLHSIQKIKEMIIYGKEKRAQNLAGFVIRGLEENWQIPIPQKKNRFDEGIVRGNPGKTSYLAKARQEQAILEEKRQKLLESESHEG